MGHSIIDCGSCGSPIMEGSHNHWECDKCGWTSWNKDEEILKIALHKVYKHLDKLVEECTEAKPTRKALAKARACLPSTYKMGFKKK